MTPIPMILTCPRQACCARHIDKGEFATKPHHTHSCQSCGFTWRPAVVDTVGVQFLPGFKDEPVRDSTASSELPFCTLPPEQCALFGHPTDKPHRVTLVQWLTGKMEIDFEGEFRKMIKRVRWR